MAIQPITRRPWEADDPERVAKFSKGTANQTSDKWTAKPDIDDCWRGDHREWHIEDGQHYQEQLYCHFWEAFINPSGIVCEGCKQHMIGNWQSSYLQEAIPGLIAAQSKEAVGVLIVQAVASGQLTEQQALELVDEFDLESA